MAGRGGGGGGGGGGGYEVPEGLQELLIEFTVSVLVEQPSDLFAYAADYFRRLQEERASVPTISHVDDEITTDDESPMEGKGP